ncbi:hypothetical protein NC653_025202 [Populus alba x Populus x berolinensis]|uniref:Uncharacterized protein n=1 Tax=Populus alba x Populus x berolinensis TaxID=444605 RepID=A0AAD6MD26_9ROSI|nr:hypothetical protein NC653_025202 [Populus alba x Populus x berolinensis]
MGVNLRPKEPRCRWVQYHTELSATGLVDSMLCLPGPLINLIPSINPKKTYIDFKKSQSIHIQIQRVILTNVMSRYPSFVFVPTGWLKLYFR